MTNIITPLRAQYPKARLELCLAQSMQALFSHDPRVDRVVTLRSAGQPTLINPDKLNIIIDSWRDPYDLLIVLDGARKSRWLAQWIRAKQKFYVDNLNDNKHIVDCYRDFYTQFIDAKHLTDAAPQLQLNQDIPTPLILNEPYIVCAPTNSTTSKPNRKNFRAWPTSYWRELIQQLSAQQVPLVLLSGPHPREVEFVEQLGPFQSTVHNLAGKTSLPQLMAIMKQAQALICTDSGSCHIAAALGTPILALYGPTGFDDTGPYLSMGQSARILSSGRACSPCYDTAVYEQCTKNRCLYDISVSQVIEALEQLAPMPQRCST